MTQHRDASVASLGHDGIELLPLSVQTKNEDSNVIV
jgi:hypothetical protein